MAMKVHELGARIVFESTIYLSDNSKLLQSNKYSALGKKQHNHIHPGSTDLPRVRFASNKHIFLPVSRLMQRFGLF